jgi:ribonuclease P protein component
VKRKFRLTRSTDFQRVRRLGKSYAHPLVVLVVLPNEQEVSRFGVAAGRSVGNAVRRNRAKRRLREVLRASVPNITPGWDLVVIARRPMVDAKFEDIQNALAGLLRKSGLYPHSNDNKQRD